MNDQEQSAREITNEAQRLEDAGLFAESLICLQAALKLDPNPILFCWAGQLAIIIERTAEAEQFFLSGIALDPKMAILYECLGQLHAEQENFSLAVDWFTQALSIDRLARTLTLLGAAQNAIGETAKARRSYTEALEIDPTYEEACYNLALILRADQPADAIALFQRAIELDPEYALAYREFGITLRHTGNYEKAESCFRRAIELDDADGWAYLYLGNLLWVNKDMAPAEQSFRKAIEVWPDVSAPYWCLGYFYECQGRAQEAAALYQKSLELDPDDITANLHYGSCLIESGAPAKARLYIEHAISLSPDDEKAKSLLSQLG